ncbi:MAG: hypothetical protein LBP31_01245 [Holosporales bacterium]|jgi:hypothetical protein|nr:hypothetical protein [Holosporales bacterium]
MKKLISNVFAACLLLVSFSVITNATKKDSTDETSVIIVDEEKIKDQRDTKNASTVTDDKTKNLADFHNKKSVNFADCLEFKFGCETDNNPVIIYVVPTCLHCGMFLAEDLNKFLKTYGQLHGVVVRFIIPTKKDLFVLKLFYNKFLNYNWENKEEKYKENKYKMYWQYVDYVKKIIATAKNRQDPSIEDLKKIALKFGFSEQDLEKAEPNQKGTYENQIIAKSADYTQQIAEISESDEVKTPCIIKGEEELEDLEEVVNTEDNTVKD